MFSTKVEQLVHSRKDTSYIEAILELCLEYGVEPDAISDALSPPIIEHLRLEGMQINLIKKSGTSFMD